MHVEMDELLVPLVCEKSAIWDVKDKKHHNRGYVKKMEIEIPGKIFQIFFKKKVHFMEFSDIIIK